MTFEAFRAELRRLRGETSLRALGRALPYDSAMLSRVENGRQAPSSNLAKALDDHYGTGGLFLGLLLGNYPRNAGGDPWEAFEVMRRMSASDLGPGQIDQIERAVFELCCDYPSAPADALRTDTVDLLRLMARQRERGRLTLAEHRELLVSAGWAALLVGCVEFDLGMKAQAEASRQAALSMGAETGNGELVAWAHEMASWFALTRSDWSAAVEHAEAGRRATKVKSVAVQLWAHQARALARLGDAGGVRHALDEGHQVLDGLPRPDRPEHHFMIDPDKWDFYAMDAFRIVGDNDLAEGHAAEVIRVGTRPDGSERWPMRMSEARFSLGMISARRGDLDGSLHHGCAGFAFERKSMPSLLASARELQRELQAKFPREAAVTEYRDHIVSLET